MTAIRFTKCHGLSNDFVLIDEPDGGEQRDWPGLARRICDRRRGVGADGVLLLLPGASAGIDAGLRIYNADGSEAEMCGNGVRCVARHLFERRGLRRARLAVAKGIVSVACEVSAGTFAGATVDMGPPRLDAGDVPVLSDRPRVVNERLNAEVAARWGLAGEDGLTLTCVSIGNPHAVLLVHDAAAVDLHAVGPRVERDAMFPERVNVQIVEIRDRTRAVVRTWERGAGATPACGTGACAALVVGVLAGRLERGATILLPGGELGVRWEERLYMTGPAELVFEGVIEA